MKFTLDNHLNVFKRMFSSQRVSSRIYLLLLLLTILLYGLAGIFPLTGIIVKKVTVQKELEELNTSLADKLDRLSGLEGILNKADEYTGYLGEAIPTKPNEQVFITKMASLAGRCGFKQRGVTFQVSENGELKTNIRYEGMFSQIPYLVGEIEKMPRVAKITKFDYSLHEGVANVNVELTIYYAEKEAIDL